MASPPIFIDSNILIAAFDKKDERNSGAEEILANRIQKADTKSLFFSQFILSEVIAHITRLQKEGKRSQHERIDYLKQLSIFDKSPRVRLLHASEEEVANAYKFVKENKDYVASIVDWTSLILAVNYNIPFILTCDKDFEKITKTKQVFGKIQILKR